MAHQFLHIDTYGMSSRPGAPKWASIRGILSEAGRVPGAVGHLATPLAPTILYGVAPETLIDEAEQLARTALDPKGRRLRRDGGILVSGVVGYPASVEELHNDPCDTDIYLLWRSKTVQWLKTTFGADLRCVIEHEDETRQHLHFFVLPILTAVANTLDWTATHPGLAAKRRSAHAGQDKRSQERSYREALRQFQDAFFETVSDFFGHKRYGPRRTRVSRLERQAQIRTEAERARMLDEVRTAEHEALLNAELEGRARVQAEMTSMRNALDQTRRDLDHERERAARAEDEIERLRGMLADLAGADFSS